MKNKLTDWEENFFKQFSLEQSRRIKREFMLNNINGGFCLVEFDSCDADEVILSVKVGSQDETGSNVTEGKLTVDRQTLVITNEVYF